MNSQITTTIQEFEDEIELWQGFRKGYIATDAELAALSLAAKTCEPGAPAWMYSIVAKLITDFASDRYYHLGEKKIWQNAIRKEVSDWRIKADLGSVPANVSEFVPCWLNRNGYKMEFSGLWTQRGNHSPDDDDILVKKMRLWAIEFGRFAQKDAIAMAFDTWRADEKQKVMADCYETLKFDPAIDPNMAELQKLVNLVIKGGNTDEETDRIRATAVIAFANFIFRIKNHMRYRWKNSCHLMIILSRVQGDGKTFTIEHLMSPLGDMFTPNSLDALKDKSLAYQFSVIPAMLFEEMQGAGKTDIDDLKSIMTGKSKLMREAYARAGVRRLMTTFIGAANRDIENLIKDNTGNRRFIQFFSNRKVPRDAISAIDVVKIWKSVDENAVEPPMYASEEAAAMIAGIQEEQRTLSPVEQWLLGAECIPWDKPFKPAMVFEDFLSWCLNNGAMSKSEANYWNATRLGATLKELAQISERYDIRITRTGGSASFRIQCPEARTVTKMDKFKTSREEKRADFFRQQGYQEAMGEINEKVEKWSDLTQVTRGALIPGERMQQIIAIHRGGQPLDGI